MKTIKKFNIRKRFSNNIRIKKLDIGLVNKNAKKINLKSKLIKALIIISLLVIYKNNKNIKFNDFFYKQKKSKIKVCMCTICRKENLYIKEFINHYKKLGYNHIFLYDNNDINEEKIEDVIPKNEIDSGFVSIIDFRGKKKGISPTIVKAFRDCYEKNNKDYDWLSFFDIDEHLEIKFSNTYTIQEYLDNQKFINCSAIKINWLAYTDNNKLFYENRPLKQRFTETTNLLHENRNVKLSVRGNLNNNYWSNAVSYFSLIVQKKGNIKL